MDIFTRAESQLKTYNKARETAEKALTELEATRARFKTVMGIGPVGWVKSARGWDNWKIYFVACVVLMLIGLISLPFSLLGVVAIFFGMIFWAVFAGLKFKNTPYYKSKPSCSDL